MEILTIRRGFEAVECNFKPLERDTKHSIPISNHSKGIRSIRIYIRTLETRFEGFESKFEPFDRHLTHSNANSNHL